MCFFGWCVCVGVNKETCIVYTYIFYISQHKHTLHRITFFTQTHHTTQTHTSHKNPTAPQAYNYSVVWIIVVFFYVIIVM